MKLTKIEKLYLLSVKLGIFVILLMMLTNCANRYEISTRDSIEQGLFCDLYQPVYTIKSDSEETKRQVDDNNIIYEECI